MRTSIIKAGAWLAVVPASASLLLADDVAAPARSPSALAVFLTWLPFLAFLGLFFWFLKGYRSRMKRFDQHMDRVEQLLERLVATSEKGEGSGS